MSLGFYYKSSLPPSFSEAVGLENAVALCCTPNMSLRSLCIACGTQPCKAFAALAYAVSSYDCSAGWFYPVLPYFHAYKLYFPVVLLLSVSTTYLTRPSTAWCEDQGGIQGKEASRKKEEGLEREAGARVDSQHVCYSRVWALVLLVQGFRYPLQMAYIKM